MEKTCYIFGAGDRTVLETRPKDGDLVIAADGGYGYCLSENIVPDLVIGDFDSGLRPDSAAEIIELPSKKDDTDTLFAVKTGFARGCSVFHIYGGTGGRADHTMANIQTLRYITDSGGKGWLYWRDRKATVIRDSVLELGRRESGYVSVFSLSDTSSGVTITGLEYELENAFLSSSEPVGISNSFIGRDAAVSVERGILLIIF